MTVLRYTTASDTWLDRLPLGDGRVGLMVGADASARRLGLNEATAWSGGLASADRDLVDPASAAEALAAARAAISAGDPQRAETAMRTLQHGYAQAFLPVGEVTITTAGRPDRAPEIVRELDLETAVHVCRAEGVTATSIVSWHSGLIVHRESYARPTDAVVSFDTPLRRVDEERADARAVVVLDLPADVAPTHEPDAPAVTWEADDVSTGTVVVIVDVEHDGAARWSGGDLVVSGANRLDIRIALTTTIRGVAAPPEPREKARSRAEGLLAAADSREAIDRHEHAFRASAPNFAFELAGDLKVIGDPHRAIIEAERRDVLPTGVLSALISYGVYLLRCSSTETGPPANLQGIWNAENEPPWESKYTVNINTEMNYWPAEVTGLQECVEPLVQMVRELAVTGAHTARTMYGARGWVCHHYTDLWRATAPIDGAQWGMWPLGGAWLCTHLWDHYDYSRDTDFLTSVYPVMRGAALFFLDTLQTDPATGYLVTNPSISPENRHPEGAAVTSGPAMDQQILRDLFRQTASAAAILGTDPDFAADIMQARSRLAPDRIGAQGQLQEWREDWDSRAPEPDHRHVSHLYALFPGSQIDPATTPDLANAARRSLELRGDESTGWATAWRINLRARLREGDRAHDVLAFLLGPGRTYPNMFDAHPPFQIDGNFGGTRAIAEMLMQSHNGTILLLPALPAAWREGSVKGLRARGGCRVDLDWRDGRMASAVLTADADGSWRVGLPGRLMEVTLAKGQTLRFGEEDLPPAP